MKLQMVQNALKQKNIKYEYTEEDDCGDYEKEIAAEILSWPDMINN